MRVSSITTVFPTEFPLFVLQTACLCIAAVNSDGNTNREYGNKTNSTLKDILNRLTPTAEASF